MKRARRKLRWGFQSSRGDSRGDGMGTELIPYDPLMTPNPCLEAQRELGVLGHHLW